MCPVSPFEKADVILFAAYPPPLLTARSFYGNQFTIVLFFIWIGICIPLAITSLDFLQVADYELERVRRGRKNVFSLNVGWIGQRKDFHFRTDTNRLSNFCT